MKKEHYVSYEVDKLLKEKDFDESSMNAKFVIEEKINDYVSFGVAKLLKEKGFNLECKFFYHDYGKLDDKMIALNHNKFQYLYTAPTLYVAQKWLRETNEIHIMIDVCASGYYAVIWKTNGTFIKTLADQGPNDGGVWDTYEESLNAGIMETLNFI